ncbi:MAG TPA: hypothetical protein VF618_28520 [Thermoanaerobaculia bacterium]
MKRAFLSVCLLFLCTCAAYKAQHSGDDPNRTRTEAEVRESVVIDEAALGAFDDQPTGIKQAVLLSEIDKYMDELKANGKYDCCVKPACRQCALTAGECHCRQIIDRNGPCCGECTQAWVEGRGNAAGVDREQVLEHLGCVRELYEKPVPPGVTPPAQGSTQSKKND